MSVTSPSLPAYQRGLFFALRYLSLFLFELPFLSSPVFAQVPIPTQTPPPRGQNPGVDQQGSKVIVNVDLVVLHTTVLDDRQRFADGLKSENFRIFEDKVEQKLSVFKREDLPVSMGLVIDNSGSMRAKRPRVNEAAITLVQASSPQDEAFLIHFNDH